MNDTKLTRDDLEAIVRLVASAEHITEFHVRYGDLEVRLSRSSGAFGETREPLPAAAVGGAQTAARNDAAEAGAEASYAGGIPPGMEVVKSPMVGTFYRAPSPGAKVFVEEGQRVEPDSVVCIIEVMKLMNSIPASVAGTVHQVLVGDGQAVQFGQPLVIIEPLR